MIASEPQGILIPNVLDIIQVDYGRVVGWGVYSNIQDADIHVDVWKRRSTSTSGWMYEYVFYNMCNIPHMSSLSVFGAGLWDGGYQLYN